MNKYLNVVVIGLLLLFGLAMAQQTPAGTSIANQASASFIDSAGQPRTTTSNQVITVVQQVFSLSISPDGATEGWPGQTRLALPGTPVYFSYTVVNTGNGTDTINLAFAQGAADQFDLATPTFHLDVNCNGTIDLAETAAISSVSLTRQGTPGASACVILGGTIPATATHDQNGNINLVGTSAGALPTVVTDNDNWARATATTRAALTATKSASPVGPVTPGSTITYTISGSNIGGLAASGVSVTGLTGMGILLADIIPTGLSVPAAPTGLAGAGTVQIVYSTDGVTWTTTTPDFPITGNGSNRVGMFISGTGAFFPQGASYTFSFTATVPTAPAGTTYLNSATLRFNDGVADRTVTSNTTTNTVASRFSVAVGGTGATAVDGPDTQTIASAFSGHSVSFTSTLQNTGNAPDSFTLSLGTSTIGACTILHSDGQTPLTRPVGPLAAGVTYRVVVRCAIPAAQTTGGSVTLTATSVGGPTGGVPTTGDGVDETTLTVTAVALGFAVDAMHNTNAALGGEPGNPANDTRAAFNPQVNPGGTAFFPFEVANTGQNPDTYTFSAALPAGWTVLFYRDADCNGAMDTPTPAPVISTGLINQGAADARCFIAAVQVPAGAAPVDADPATGNVHFTATSTTLVAVTDTIRGAVDVNLVAQVSLEPPRSGTATTPGTIQYTHNLVNSSNLDATCSITGTGGTHEWTYQLSLDGITWAASLSGVLVAANGGSQTIQVRVLVPAGQPIGRSDTNALTATCTLGAGPATASDTVTQTTTVVGGDLTLAKTGVSFVGATTAVRSATAAIALPGDQIEYTLVARNIGTGSLQQVIVADPLPAHTSFVSVSASVTGFPTGSVLFSTNGTTWSTTPPTTLATGGSVFVAVDTNADNTITSADLMPPAATLTIVFRVQVQ